MNSKLLAKQYEQAKVEERFALVLAAEMRGDDIEARRLASAAERITLEMNDFAPHLQAFHQWELLVFCELHEAAACADEYFAMCDSAALWQTRTPNNGESEEGNSSKAKPLSQRDLDLSLANNYLLKVKKAGWDLFCERLSVPPIFLWTTLPGWDRLERALELAEQAAFEPANNARLFEWNSTAGRAPERTELKLNAVAFADKLSVDFVQQTNCFRGRG